jgi:branched-chain amino acid transport system ATP-binding protein
MLEVKGLRVNYGEAVALRGVDLTVERGTVVSLVGSNGAGKSTLVKALMGMQPISGGSVFFEGDDITGRPATERPALGIALVPEGRRLFKDMSVRDNLMIGLHHPAARRRALAGRKVDAMLAEVYEVFPVLGRRPRQAAGTLSGGEQQMVALGRALISNPSLLVLDEPSLGLAPIVVQEVFATIERVTSAGVTVLLAEQNMQKALELSDYGYVIADGTVVLEDTGAALLSSDSVRKAYLGDR